MRTPLASSVKAAGVAHYNDYYDFIFESTHVGRNQDGTALYEAGWDINVRGAVAIHRLCTTDPEQMDEPSWTAR